MITMSTVSLSGTYRFAARTHTHPASKRHTLEHIVNYFFRTIRTLIIVVVLLPLKLMQHGNPRAFDIDYK